MGFWDSLVQNVGGAIAGISGPLRSDLPQQQWVPDSVSRTKVPPSGGPFGITPSYGEDGPNAFAAYWPPYEVLTPQYPYPSPYTLTDLGYRKNEIVFALINKKST